MLTLTISSTTREAMIDITDQLRALVHLYEGDGPRQRSLWMQHLCCGTE